METATPSDHTVVGTSSPKGALGRDRAIMPAVALFSAPCAPMGSVRTFQVGRWGASFKPSRPAHGQERRHSRKAASISAVTLPVDPSIALWQQPAVHQAALLCTVAIAGSCLACSLCETVLRKAANKVRQKLQLSCLLFFLTDLSNRLSGIPLLFPANSNPSQPSPAGFGPGAGPVDQDDGWR